MQSRQHVDEWPFVCACGEAFDKPSHAFTHVERCRQRRPSPRKDDRAGGHMIAYPYTLHIGVDQVPSRLSPSHLFSIDYDRRQPARPQYAL
jgi:hypothetical protein